MLPRPTTSTGGWHAARYGARTHLSDHFPRDRCRCSDYLPAVPERHRRIHDVHAKWHIPDVPEWCWRVHHVCSQWWHLSTIPERRRRVYNIYAQRWDTAII